MVALKETHLRSIVKGISWRLIASTDTIIIAYFITGGNLKQALGIGLGETISKIFLYYLHERIWIYLAKYKVSAPKISFFKAITWRFIGTLDTFLISLLIMTIFNDPENMNPERGKKAGMIATIEVFTKVILYYLHERMWQKLPPGSFRKIMRKIKRTFTAKNQ